MGIAFIGRRELAYAFNLIGIDTYVIDELSEAKVTYEKVVEKGNIDVLILEEQIYKYLRELNIHKIGNLIKPVILVVPNIEGSEGFRLKELYNLISQAVGVKLELER